MKEVVQIREVVVSYRGPKYNAPKLVGPDDAAKFFRKVIGDGASREHFVAMFLDARHRAIGYQVVSIGTATASLVHPREVFQPAVAIGAAAIIIAHNHPAGDPSPSSEDREVTKRLKDAGKVLGIRVLDHLVIGAAGQFVSIEASE